MERKILRLFFYQSKSLSISKANKRDRIILSVVLFTGNPTIIYTYESRLCDSGSISTTLPDTPGH